MRKYKRTLLHGLLFAALSVTPVAVFGGQSDGLKEGETKLLVERSEKNGLEVEKTQARFRFGVSYGRPYYYRPYYFHRPYRPHYYRPYYHPYRPYRPYHYYRW